MRSSLSLLLACAAAHVGGKLIDDIDGHWIVTEVDVGAMAKELRATDEIRPEDDVEFTRAGVVDLNATAGVKGQLTGRALIGRPDAYQSFDVRVESPKKSKVATISFFDPNEDDSAAQVDLAAGEDEADIERERVPYLSFHAKTEPFGAGRMSTRRYTSRAFGEGQAQVYFHTGASFFVALFPDGGANIPTRSFWFTRKGEEPSVWDQWPLYATAAIGLVLAKVFTTKLLGGGAVKEWHSERAANLKKKTQRQGVARTLASPLARRRKKD